MCVQCEVHNIFEACECFLLCVDMAVQLDLKSQGFVDLWMKRHRSTDAMKQQVIDPALDIQ